MAQVRTPAGTRVFVQSAISAKQAITAIALQAPPVVTYSGADPANGNYAALVDMFGTTELEDALVKVANVNTTANTFEAEDQDATGYGTFASGNLQIVTLATEIQIATGFTIDGFEQQFEEYNLLNDRITRRHPTVVSAGSMRLPCIWDPADAGLAALRAAGDTAKKLGFKILFPDGLEMLFFGHVGASGMPTAESSTSIMRTDVSVTIATRPRYVFP
jgi:hypothetical protein